MPDQRLSHVLKTCNQIVADAGGSIVTEGQLLTIIGACASNEVTRKAMIGLIYEAAKIADRVEADSKSTPNVPTTRLERQLAATLQVCTFCKGTGSVGHPMDRSLQRSCNGCNGTGKVPQ